MSPISWPGYGTLMMPRSADRQLFAAHRALARALERMAPLHRKKCVSALARALVDNDRKTIGAMVRLLGPADIARAHREARDLDRQDYAASIVRGAASLIGLLRRIGVFMLTPLTAVIDRLK